MWGTKVRLRRRLIHCVDILKLKGLGFVFPVTAIPTTRDKLYSNMLIASTTITNTNVIIVQRFPQPFMHWKSMLEHHTKCNFKSCNFEGIKSKAEADLAISNMMRLEGGQWTCNNCDYSQARRDVVYKHIDTKHYFYSYQCEFCYKTSPSQHALKEHNRTYHK